MRRPMSKERAREIADNPGTSIVSDTRRALLWALDELSARDGEIISLKARIITLETPGWTPPATCDHQYAPNNRGGCTGCDRDGRDGN